MTCPIWSFGRVHGLPPVTKAGFTLAAAPAAGSDCGRWALDHQRVWSTAHRPQRRSRGRRDRAARLTASRQPVYAVAA
jgi:hypothetical protein